MSIKTEVPALAINTPLEDHRADHGLIVKREDLCAPAPWPPFSKTRGVLSYMEKRMAEGVRTFGVLDTYHSQGGWAVAAAGARLGARVINYFPVYTAERDTSAQRLWPLVLRPQQVESLRLGAELAALPAGRSAVLYHQARRHCEAAGGHMYPNALKLVESVEETALEVIRTIVMSRHSAAMSAMPWIVPASSGTLAAGVLRGLHRTYRKPPPLIVHMGYSRPAMAVIRYVREKAEVDGGDIVVVNERYAYKDPAKDGPTPPWASNQFYDLKAYRWHRQEGRSTYGDCVFWNIG